MRLIHFFALKDDLVAILQLVESKGHLAYFLMGNFVAEEIKDELSPFSSGSEIPILGSANADQTAGCDAFLVGEFGRPINLRKFRGYDGRERVCVDQLINPDTVTFTPAGMWAENTILNGSIGTASDSQVSQALMKRFHSAVKKACTKVKAFYVGPKAFALREKGMRFTGAIQSPPESDLVFELDKN